MTTLGRHFPLTLIMKFLLSISQVKDKSKYILEIAVEKGNYKFEWVNSL